MSAIVLEINDTLSKVYHKIDKSEPGFRKTALELTIENMNHHICPAFC